MLNKYAEISALEQMYKGVPLYKYIANLGNNYLEFGEEFFFLCKSFFGLEEDMTYIVYLITEHYMCFKEYQQIIQYNVAKETDVPLFATDTTELPFSTFRINLEGGKQIGENIFLNEILFADYKKRLEPLDVYFSNPNKRPHVSISYILTIEDTQFFGYNMFLKNPEKWQSLQAETPTDLQKKIMKSVMSLIFSLMTLIDQNRLTNEMKKTCSVSFAEKKKLKKKKKKIPYKTVYNISSPKKIIPYEKSNTPSSKRGEIENGRIFPAHWRTFITKNLSSLQPKWEKRKSKI